MINETNLGNILSTVVNLLHGHGISLDNLSERNDSPQDTFQLCTVITDPPPDPPSTPTTISIPASESRSIRLAAEALRVNLTPNNRNNLLTNFVNSATAISTAFWQRRVRVFFKST